jgi:hypothetical protein
MEHKGAERSETDSRRLPEGKRSASTMDRGIDTKPSVTS